MTDQFDELLNALEDERRYMAKELHDGVAQTTLQLGLQAGICRKLLERGNLDMLANELAQLEERLQLASSQVREMIQDMRPPTVEPDASLDDYVKYAIDIHTQRGGPPVTYQFNQPENQFLNLSSAQVLTLTRIIQEALLNIRKHAQAQNVRLALSTEEDNIYLTIADDGQGFDSAEVESRFVDKGGAGLTNLYMRAKAIGGTLTIGRDTTGQGTKITLILSK
jgi:two-component system sensor histidine kinase DegS